MVFKAHETVGGLKHLSCGVSRIVLRRSREHYVRNFLQSTAVECHAATDLDGMPAYCNVCGYRRIVAGAPTGWTVEMCSAAPPLPLSDPRFQLWMRSVVREKLPTPCV